MTLFAVSDAVWFALIAAVGLAIKQYFDWRLKQAVAEKVTNVQTSLDENTKISKQANINAAHAASDAAAAVTTATATHDLVNSQAEALRTATALAAKMSKENAVKEAYDRGRKDEKGNC